MTLAVVLLVIGLGFVLAEVFFPSLGMFGLLAGGCILLADISAFGQGRTAGYVFVGAEIVLVPLVVHLGFKVLPKLPFGRRMILLRKDEDKGAGLPDLAHLRGRTGVALTTLRPAGTARLDGTRQSVVSLEGMLAAGTPVVVVEVEGSEVRVRAAPPA
jgi:membrane-bound serine protease (ClpP class)